jgi:hypothetical protein
MINPRHRPVYLPGKKDLPTLACVPGQLVHSGVLQSLCCLLLLLVKPMHASAFSLRPYVNVVWVFCSMLQSLGGVVSAEEMAPFLDPPALGRSIRSGPNKYEDESFVLPALLRFGGEPFVDDDGRLLYKFPALQVSKG